MSSEPHQLQFENLDAISHGRGRSGPPPEDDDQSVATTILATEVGSVVGAHKDAFLRSITFFKDRPERDWSIELTDPPVSAGRRAKKNQKITVGSVGGSISLSTIQAGDVLKKVNGKRIGPSFNAQRARELMDDRLENDGVLHIEVGNNDGSDILVEATVLKPEASMTYEDMGMVVWLWGVLCIKSIDKKSLFHLTALKSEDHIISINDILCDRITPEAFAHILNELPLQVTIVVKRGKQRWSGMFG